MCHQPFPNLPVLCTTNRISLSRLGKSCFFKTFLSAQLGFHASMMSLLFAMGNQKHFLIHCADCWLLSLSIHGLKKEDSSELCHGGGCSLRLKCLPSPLPAADLFQMILDPQETERLERLEQTNNSSFLPGFIASFQMTCGTNPKATSLSLGQFPAESASCVSRKPLSCFPRELLEAAFGGK